MKKTNELYEFEYATGMLGATKPNQLVTCENVASLPPGSVVRIGDGGRLIRLHEDFWLWISGNGCAHRYDKIENLKWQLDEKSTVCHLAPRRFC